MIAAENQATGDVILCYFCGTQDAPEACPTFASLNSRHEINCTGYCVNITFSNFDECK